MVLSGVSVITGSRRASCARRVLVPNDDELLNIRAPHKGRPLCRSQTTASQLWQASPLV